MSRRPRVHLPRAVVLVVPAVLLLALVTTFAFATPAYAMVDVTWGALPGGWTVDERDEAAGYSEYAIYFQKEYQVEADHTYGALAYLQEDHTNHFAGPEEFAAAFGIEETPDDTDGYEWEKTWHKYESGTTTVGDRNAYYVTLSYDGFNQGMPVSDAMRSTDYWVDLDDGSAVFIRVQVTADSWMAASSVRLGEVEALWAEAQSIFQSWKIDWEAGASTDTSVAGPPSTDFPGTTETTLAPASDAGNATGSNTKPWRTATGGALAVAAAVVAILSAATKTPQKTDGKDDPNRPIGYILHVSADSLTLSREQSQPFTVRVLQVLRDGRTEPAAANVTLAPPAGVAVQPAAGPSPLSALIWRTAATPAGAGVLVQATAAGGGSQTTVPITAEGAAKLNIVFHPTDKNQLIVGGSDQVTVVATVVPPAGMPAGAGVDVAAVRKSIDFTSAGEWLDLSAAVDWGEGRAINVEASQPDPNHPKDPPPACVVQVKAEYGDTALSDSISIAIVNPKIDATPDTVEFAAGSRSSAEVRAWIDPPGPQWTFETAWAEGSRALARVDAPEVTGPGVCRLTLTEDAAGKLDTSRPEDSATLRVLAKAPGCGDLERDIKVIVGQEGLFVDATGRNSEDGSYHVAADGKGRPAEVDFRVYVRDDDGTIRLDQGLARSLEFTLTDEPDSRSRNGAEVAQLSIEYSAPRGVETPSATYRATVKSPIPGDVPVLPVRYEVSVPARSGDDKFTKEFTLGLVPSRNAPGGPDWQRERDLCLRVINDYVPLKYQLDLKRILDRRAPHLGADGLYEFRRRAWVIAQDLTLGEGGMGYHDEAKWANRIVEVGEYAIWAGDIAFHAATAHFVGPWAAMGIAQAKELIVSAILAYEEGLTPDAWFWQYVGGLPALFEGQMVDVDKFEKLTGDNKVKAWALFVGYHFFKNYLYNGKSFTDSLIEAGRQARDEAIAAWLGKKLKEEAAGGGKGADVQKPKADEGAGTSGGPSAQGRARDWAARIKEATSGGEKMPPEMVADLMRDPDAARELRRTDPAAYGKYADARGDMRQAHDTELTQTLKDRYGRDVRVETVGSERGIDRDYRVLVEVPDPSDPSKGMWIELPPREWAADSNRIFAGQTGGPTGPDTPETRAQQAKYAADHQQLGTDVDSRQACADMSDQFWVKDAQGNLVPTQRVGPDPKTGELRPLTNIDRVENGDGRLISGEKTGETYQDKVADSMPTGPDGKPRPTLDALAQANKAGETLNGCREGYQKQGLDPGPLDPKVSQGMNIVKQGADMKWTPEQTDKALRDQAGFEGGLPDYMKAVSGGFKQLDSAK